MNEVQNITNIETVIDSVSVTTSDEINTTNLISILSIVFEQIRLQQEVRDRWFTHYISIIGAIAAISTFCFGFFKDKVSDQILFLLIGAIFFLAFIIGILFYMLYLYQRQNYKKLYKMFSSLQKIILKDEFKKSKSQIISNSLQTKKIGADFITLLIENILCSTCISLSVMFMELSFLFTHILIIVVISILSFGVCSLILLIIYKKMEEK